MTLWKSLYEIDSFENVCLQENYCVFEEIKPRLMTLLTSWSVCPSL